MEFETVLKIIDTDPVFETSLFLSGNTNPKIVRLQLSRWVRSGRIFQLRRGLYTLAPPFQKIKPHPFLVANRLQKASYVSLQSALAYYGLIPEIVNSTVNVTTRRPERLETPLGNFEFRHIKPDLFFGYQMIDLGRQQALVAKPEKALLDLVYLHPGGESTSYLKELRLQNLEYFNLNTFKELSEVFDSPKMHTAVKNVTCLVQSEIGEYTPL